MGETWVGWKNWSMRTKADTPGRGPKQGVQAGLKKKQVLLGEGLGLWRGCHHHLQAPPLVPSPKMLDPAFIRTGPLVPKLSWEICQGDPGCPGGMNEPCLAAGPSKTSSCFAVRD